MKKLLKLNILLSAMLLLLSGCEDNSEQISNFEPVNSFSMFLNNESWKPTKQSSSTDNCFSTFNYQFSFLSTKDVPTIQVFDVMAFRDGHISGNFDNSANALEMHLADINSPGVYKITGNISEQFSSYVRFSINNYEEERRLYVNDTEKGDFVIEINEVSSNISNQPRLEAAFFGTLYNENDPNDFILLDAGKIDMNKSNTGDFNHCLN